MRDEDKGYSGVLLYLFQLLLHILAQLQVKGAERLVKEQYLRLVYECTCNSYTLLLTARETCDAAFGEAGEHNHRKHALYLFLYLLFRQSALAKRKRHIFKDIQMRKQSILLKYGIDMALMRRNIVYTLAHKDNVAAVGIFKAADNSQCGGLSAA